MAFDIFRWAALSPADKREVITRPALADESSRVAAVKEILDGVRGGGDAALRSYGTRFDNVSVGQLAVEPEEFENAERELKTPVIQAIDTAIAHVRSFHERQWPKTVDIETAPGIRCQRVCHPLDSVGLYVPAGTAPLPSTAIMLSVPAAVAGCPQRVLCTPPRSDGMADAGVLVAAKRSGIDTVFKLGGAHAIAAMAYGTETVPRVCKIFGPGSAWVTTAKSLVATDPQGAAIDMPAGPSEVLVVADELANAEFVAADLLSQAEHGEDSQAVLVSTSRALIDRTLAAIEVQLSSLPRREIARQSLRHARFVVASDVHEAIEISNTYAPEHLILQLQHPREHLPSVRNAGSVFLGPWSPEAVGDYCSGTNHVLPTYGSARAYSGLGLADFLRTMTVQELSFAGLTRLAPTVRSLAELEGLDAHAAAVRVRLADRSGGTR